MSQSGDRGVPLSASARAALQASSFQAASSSGDVFRRGGGFAQPFAQPRSRATAAPGGGQPPTPSARKRRVPHNDGAGEGLDTTMPSFDDSEEEEEYRERLLGDEDEDGEDEGEGAIGEQEQEEDEEEDEQEEAFDPLNMADLTGNPEASPAARRSKSFESFYERRPSGNIEQRRGRFKFCVPRVVYERAVGGEPLEPADLVPGPFAPLKGLNARNYPENPNQERLACFNCANYWTKFRHTSGHSGHGAGSTDVWTCNCGSTLRGVPNRCLLCPICSADERLMAVLKHSCKMPDGRYRTGYYRPRFSVDALFEKDKVLKGKELDATGARDHMKCEKCGWDPSESQYAHVRAPPNAPSPPRPPPTDPPLSLSPHPRCFVHLSTVQSPLQREHV